MGGILKVQNSPVKHIPDGPVVVVEIDRIGGILGIRLLETQDLSVFGDLRFLLEFRFQAPIVESAASLSVTAPALVCTRTTTAGTVVVIVEEDMTRIMCRRLYAISQRVT